MRSEITVRASLMLCKEEEDGREGAATSAICSAANADDTSDTAVSVALSRGVDFLDDLRTIDRESESPPPTTTPTPTPLRDKEVEVEDEDEEEEEGSEAKGWG